jgi:hypothetical protein
VDTGKAFLFNQIFSLARNAELDIGKISYTEASAPKSASVLRFNIDSLRAKGDTMSATADDGTAIINRLYN